MAIAGGGVDIYGLRVEGSKNPVNGQNFEPVNSIMNYPYGNIVWDEYTTNLLNSTADKPILGDNWIITPFPDTIGIRAVDEHGQPLEDVFLELYPVEWFSYSVSPTPILWSLTRPDGSYVFSRNPFQPSTNGYPWTMRYANFLIKATYNSATVYAWMPLYDVQNTYFRHGANSAYTVDIQFPASTSTIRISSVSATTVCVNDAIEVSFTTAGSFAPDNQFHLLIVDANNNSYAIARLDGTTGATLSGVTPIFDRGTYKVRIVSTKPKISSTSVWLTVKPKPNQPFIRSLSLCQHAPAPQLAAQGQHIRWYTDSVGGTGSAASPTIDTGQPKTTSFFVSQTIDGCESSRARMDVVVKPLPAAPGVTPKNSCQFDEPEPARAVGVNLTWYTPEGIPLASAPLIRTDSGGTFTYQVTQTVNGCEGPKASLVVNVLTTPPPVVVSPTINVCQGAPAQPLEASGTNLRWTSPNGVITTEAPVPSTLNATQPGGDLYSVTQTGANGCQSPETTIRVFVHTVPTLSVGGTTTANLGESVPLHLSFSGVGPYQYTLSNGLTGTATRDTFLFVLPERTTTYLVTTVSNRCGTGMAGSGAIVTVLIPTLQTLPLSATSACVGEGIIVRFSTTGRFTSGNAFTLQLAGVVPDSSKATFVDILTSQPTEGQLTGVLPLTTVAGQYWVRAVATNPKIPVLGTVSPSVLSVRPKATATLTGSQTIIAGQSTTLSVEFSGEGPWVFTYRDSTGTGPGATQSLQATTNPYALQVKPEKTTVYYLTSVSNGCGHGRILTDRAWVNVSPLLANQNQPLEDVIDVFPLPATSSLTVRIRALLKSRTASLAISSLSGQLLIQQQTDGETTLLNLDTLSAGVYILSIRMENQTVYRRIVKR